ncbi:Calcium-binding protein [Cupriavidus taiwanensis]|uniref:Ig-like domain-containing protein n=1 Tax=Cupriavidus taiwanensis TaxID=164546 RepID=UPI000E17E79F|nr:Ig-like domain-containing protein [Cupriavidus taiwanensis]SPA18501.1 Calcium-binding protein [Cupriavidus taiwanensis]
MASSGVLLNHTDVPVAPGTRTVASPDGPANFLIAAQRDSVANFAREGNDLLLTMRDGSTLLIQGFFTNGAQYNNLVFVQEDGQWLADFSQALGTQGDGVAEAAMLFEPIGDSASTALLLGLLGAAAGAGIIAAAATGGGGGDGSSGGGTPLATPKVAPTNGAALSGTAPAGSTVGIDFNGDGKADATVTADAAGNWTYTPAQPLADGTVVSVTATDGSGNTSPPATVTVDGAAPAAPAISAASNDAGTAIVAGGSTSDTTPTLSGSAEAGSTVSIYSGTTLLGTAIADANGRWSFTPPSGLADGNHALTVTATDAVGNTGPASAPFLLTVDTAAPAAPTITPSDGSAIAGTAEPGSTIHIDLNGDGAPDATVTANDSGNWTYTPSPALGDGAVVTVTATDAAGNTSAPATATIDTSAPAAPVIGSVTDDATPSTGPLADGDGTNDSTPALTGTAEAGSTINIYNGATLIGTTVADATTGAWSFTSTSPLPDGAVSLTVTATDAAGNTSAPSTAFTLTLDATPPAIPAITGATDDNPVSTPLASGDSTNDSTPTLTGTADAGSTISIYNGTTLIGTTVADATTGAWSFTPTTPLTDGPYALTATATDTSGNVSAPTAAFNLTVDTAPPADPVITQASGTTISGSADAGSTIDIDLDGDGTPDATVTADATTGTWTYTPGTPMPDGTAISVIATDAAGNTSAPATATVDALAPSAPTITSVTDDNPVASPLNSGDSTNDSTPTLAGTAEAGSTISIYNGTTLLGTTVADATTGAWSFTPTMPLTDGPYALTATATDTSGNVSAPTAAFNLTVDTAPSADPVITQASGTTISGTAEAGSTVDIDLDGDGTPDATVTADATTGAWTYSPGTPLPDGTGISVTATDAAGNTSAPVTATVDATPPAIPAITGATDDNPVSTPLASGDSTNDSTPTLTGSADAGSTISIYNGATLIGTTVADATTGAWSFTPTTPLTDGPYALTATATDAAGNVSAPTAAFNLTVDTAAPADPIITVANGTTLSGTAEAGSTVNIDLDGDGNPEGTVTADASTGEWTYSPAGGLPDGAAASVTASDAAGNTSGPATVTIDAVPPAIPAITGATDDNPVSTPLASGDSTNDSTPTLTGTADAGSAINIFNGATLIGTTVADVTTGAWSFTPTTPLTDGPYALTATATDAAGNISAPTAAFNLTVDTAAPADPIITVANGTTLSGTAEAGSTVNIDLDGDGNPEGTVTADATTGAWTYSPAGGLPDGVVASVTASDAAGNTSGPATVTIDAVPPAVPLITSITDDNPVATPLNSGDNTNDSTPTLAGSADPGSAINIFNGATLIGTTVADATTGAWSFTPTTPLTDGPYALTATATDAAGNISAPTATFNLTVDTVAPTATVAVTALTDDTGATGDWITADITPVVSGTLSAALAPNERLEVSIDGGATWTDAVVTGNTWQWFPTGQLADGTYTITTHVTDSAGNIGAVTTQNFTVAHQAAPEAAVNEAGGLLGIADADLLGLIDLSAQQFFTASDYNENINSVVIEYGGLLGVGMQRLDASLALAAELGLTFNVVNDPGVLGVLGPSSTLSISAVGGGPIDNLSLNELLGSITLEGGLLGVSVGLLDAMTITATDTTGMTTTSTGSQLVSAGVLTNLLGASQPSAIIEGDATGNTLTGSADNDRLYGYDGNDTINAGAGNDLVRGGAGDDTLNGEGGNDVIIGGAGNDTMSGGAGTDVFLWEARTNDGTGGNGADVITDFTVGTAPGQAGNDVLDVSALLVGYAADANGPAHYQNGVATIDAGDNIGQYLSATQQGADTVITIDRDGAGTDYSAQTLATLTNVTTNLETLLANQQILV